MKDKQISFEHFFSFVEHYFCNKTHFEFNSYLSLKTILEYDLISMLWSISIELFL